MHTPRTNYPRAVLRASQWLERFRAAQGYWDNHAVSPGTYWGTSFNDAGKGFLHKMEWSCPGVTIINSGSYVLHGYCVLTDSEDLRHVRR